MIELKCTAGVKAVLDYEWSTRPWGSPIRTFASNKMLEYINREFPERDRPD